MNAPILARPMPRRVAILATLFVLLSALVPSTVLAHAQLEESDPADGASVAAGEVDVVLQFNDTLVEDSRFTLRGPDGAVVGRGAVDPDRRSTMTGTFTLTAAGEYEVQWQAKIDDGHNELERDTFSFTVLEPTPSPSPTPTLAPSATPEPTAAPTPSPSATVAPSPSPAPAPAGGSGGDALIPVVAALVVVGGLAFYLLRRGRAA